MTPTRREPAGAIGDGFALALGAGGARGLAHVVVLEALDELGVRPVAIAGSSVGALVGAAYAAGMDGRAIRETTLEAVRKRATLTAAIMAARARRIAGVAGGSAFTLDGERLLHRFWPKGAATTFEQLRIPLRVVATDYGARAEAVLDQGPLLPAVAGSIAIPGLVRPVRLGKHLLVDGGAVNPLPFDLLAGRATFTVAIDVSGVRPREPSRLPGPFDTMFGTLQIMQAAIVQAKLRVARPQVVLRPAVDRYRVLDFMKAHAVLAAAEPVKDEVKRALGRVLEHA